MSSVRNSLSRYTKVKAMEQIRLMFSKKLNIKHCQIPHINKLTKKENKKILSNNKSSVFKSLIKNKNMKMLIFDTETNGLPKTKLIGPKTIHLWPYITQFSFIVYDYGLENRISATYTSNIQLPLNEDISPELISLTGITKDMCMKGDTIKTAIITFMEQALNVDMIVGHNIEFDINMVKITLVRLIGHETDIGLVNKYKQYLKFLNEEALLHCTMKHNVKLCALETVGKTGRTYYKYPKLSDLHNKLFQYVPTRLHHSFCDVLITLRCITKLIMHKQDLYEHDPSFKKLYDLYIGDIHAEHISHT